MHKQVEEFKINSVRQLRMSCERLTETCQRVPSSVFYYLQFKFETIILTESFNVKNEFDQNLKNDKDTKDDHLRLFRPNLENPANKDMTKELN